MKGTLDHSRKKKIQQPVAQTADSGFLNLVNTTISKFQSFHKITPLGAGKDASLDPPGPWEENNQMDPTEEADASQKVKILRGLSAEDILNKVTNALAKVHIPSKIKNVWEHCCNEVEQEIIELNKILEKLELPPSNYTKEKSFAWDIYEDQPDLTCHTKDFLDFYIFPFLLPAVHSLLDFAKENRVFQCRYITFNSIDYIIENLYNKNPLHPERRDNPKTIDEIAYLNNWQSKFPRSPLPNWLTMSEDTAAIKIQTTFRGFMVRLRPDVREMRQFWKDYKEDMAADERRKSSSGRSSTPIEIDSFDDIRAIQNDEDESHRLSPHETHSEECLICSRYREFFAKQEALEAERAEKIKEEEEMLRLEMEAEEAEYLELVDISPHLLHNAQLSTASTASNTKTQPEHSFKSTIDGKNSSK